MLCVVGDVDGYVVGVCDFEGYVGCGGEGGE